MPRIARIIAPGIPHHIGRRGNRRMETFFRDAGYSAVILGGYSGDIMPILSFTQETVLCLQIYPDFSSLRQSSFLMNLLFALLTDFLH
jgi:hypothetical protein